MPTTESNGITIHYEEQGQGEPLLLIMGLGGQLTDWPAGLVDLLAERFRVIRFDNRDIGLSSTIEVPPPGTWSSLRAAITGRQPEAPYQLADMANDTVGLLDHLGIESVQVVGASMGGMIAQQLAIDHPERVSGLVSIMSTTGNRRVGRPSPSLVSRLAARRPPPADAPIDEVVDQAIDLYEAISGPARNLDTAREVFRHSIERSYRPDGTARQLAAIQGSPDRTSELGALSIPTLVVHGQVDPLVRLSGGLATVAAVPGSRLVVFPEMGHDLPATRWAEMVDLIEANARAGRPTAGPSATKPRRWFRRAARV
ncbi:MAG: alpha/beta hydrolase [Actinomycetota bacterium]